MSTATENNSTAARHHRTPPPSSPVFEVYNDTFEPQQDKQALTMVLPVIILFFFLIGFFTIYLFHDILQYITNAWLAHRGVGPDGPPPGQQQEVPHGLHPSIVASFPVFPYSSVKRLRQRKYGLICAICLGEFDDDDTVRLLTVCSHAFHPECIDLWLASHRTCPVCRSNLEKRPEELAIIFALAEGDGEGGEDSHCISVKDEGEAEGSRREDEGRLQKTLHSSGCSAASERRRPMEEEDEYTLRLPEDVEVEMLHSRTDSGTASNSVLSSPATTGDHVVAVYSGS